MDASVQRLYGPRGGMAFTRQSGGTCVPSAYKHLFVMTDLYRPFLLPNFDSVEDCFPYDGKLSSTNDKFKLFDEHYARFLSKMTSIPKRNFFYKRFDDRKNQNRPGKEYLFLPKLANTLPFMRGLAKKVREMNLTVPRDTGIVFVSSPDGKGSHALACVAGTFIDSNLPNRPNQFQAFKDAGWRLQTITVVAVDPDMVGSLVPQAQAAKERIDRGIVIQEYPHFRDYAAMPPDEREDFLRNILIHTHQYALDVAHLPNAKQLTKKLQRDFKSLKKEVAKEDSDFAKDFSSLRFHNEDFLKFWQKHPASPPVVVMPVSEETDEIAKTKIRVSDENPKPE